MRGLVLAWAVGLGLLTWRTVQTYHKPPVPGRLAGASVVFVLLALLAEYEPARRAAVLAAWAFDLAVLLQIPPDQLTSTAGFGTPSTSSTASTATAARTGPAAGGRRRG